MNTHDDEFNALESDARDLAPLTTQIEESDIHAAFFAQIDEMYRDNEVRDLRAAEVIDDLADHWDRMWRDSGEPIA